MLASEYGHTEIVKLLLKYGADIYFRNNSLLIASSRGHTEIVKLLLYNGANVNYIDADGYNSLMKAVLSGDIEIIKLLLDNGANIYHVNKNAETAYTITNKKPVLDAFYKYLIENEKYVIHICN
jgi:ankyrin repeat protein